MKKPFRSFLIISSLSVFLNPALHAEVVEDTLGVASSSARTVESLLQGRVSGVRVWSQDGSPMSALGVSIRGVNSLRGGNHPLYVVDGTMLNESDARNIDPLWQYTDAAYASSISLLSFLAPSEIETIEVLKNTSATALYGSKGADGVILITTKRLRDERSGIFWDSNIDVALPETGKGTSTGISHNHRLMFGAAGKGNSYLVSGYFRDDNYIVPGTGAMKGGLRASFETKANAAVWFGLNSVSSVGTTASACAGAWYGSPSHTLDMRMSGTSVDGWAADYDDDALEFRSVNSMWLQLNFTKGFSFRFDIGADIMSHRRRFWWGNGTPLGYENNGVAANLKSSVFAYNASGRLDYHCYVANDHKLTVSAGAQASGGMEMLNAMNGVDFYDHALRANALNLAASRADLHKFTLNDFALGLHARLVYAWKDILGADFTFRTDYIPEFGKWEKYPSVSAWWDMRNTFFRSSSAVSALRIEGGYGESGRQEAMPYALFGKYTPGEYEQVDARASAFFDGRSYQHGREWNISLETGFIGDRLTLEAGYYSRNTSDCLTLYSKGEKVYSFWQFAERKEISSQESTVSNRGVEFSLAGIPVQTGEWNLSVGINGAYNVNRISSLAAEDAGGKPIGQSIVATANVEDCPVSSIVDAGGKVIGNPIPKYHGGLSTTLRWKDLSLDLLAVGALGFDILNLNAMARDGVSAVSAEYVEKGDFFRLARVSMAYDVPVERVRWMDSLKVFATVSDPLAVTDYSGWSPDVNSYAASLFRHGIDYGSYPPATSFIVGFSIRF